ncbi:DUF2605 domain-containing protein [Rivularia sp. UHCC 0363]|uniref:DUF2605 domain-containing protein n=1 Tax=Rivularia sp. UHCC 0363 TaxID=3110244 RepID=UPI002B20AE32|nr:DUF2605 domain-containing protein [Rivularia sp. UHCC 0363]MEA5594820.1 DUF2605 domain-containing protein [Rivularia sp. UHCC 0363]
MRDSNLPEPELLKTVLQPLLEDFEYWFTRSRTFLETEQLSFLDKQEQSNLLKRVKLAAGEVQAAKMLFAAAGGKVGIDMATLMPWHKLVTECWNVAMKFRSKQDSVD